MVFSSIVFIFFFLPCCILGYYCVFKTRNGKNRWLLLCSLFFYAWGGIRYLPLILLSVGANWLIARQIGKAAEEKRKKLLLGAGIACNVALLFVFKYLAFTIQNVNTVFGVTLEVPSIVLPIGISFFTFQGMSYVIDVYRKKAGALKNPLDVGLYIAFFPQLIAGPIVRFDTVAAQINDRKESWAKFWSGIVRFMIGLGKKTIIANTIALVAKEAFEGRHASSVLFAWMGALAYTFQIYFDFSGYSDMAIGLGRMFGFHFQENFDTPYISKSISEFWRRWHISMGTWFRDYVYIPLGGSRASGARVVCNLAVVWFLTGLWHGANWTFILWGALQFSAIIIERCFGWHKKAEFSAWTRPLHQAATMLIVILGWVLFNSVSIESGFSYIASMFRLSGPIADPYALTVLRENAAVFLLAAVFSFPVKKRLLSLRRSEHQKAITVTEGAAVLLIFVISVAYIVKGTYNPFIYFNF